MSVSLEMSSYAVATFSAQKFSFRKVQKKPGKTTNGSSAWHKLIVVSNNPSSLTRARLPYVCCTFARYKCTRHGYDVYGYFRSIRAVLLLYFEKKILFIGSRRLKNQRKSGQMHLLATARSFRVQLYGSSRFTATVP